MRIIKMDNQSIKITIEECLKVGWRWRGSDEYGYMLVPPLNDIRQYWCAQWIPIEKGSNKRYPHWIEPNVMLEKKDE
jgi:hypothetical protein